MADQKITDFPVLSQGGVDVLNDVIPIVDVNLDLNKKITPASIVGAVLPSPGPIGASTPNTGAFTNITIDNLTVLAAGTANGVAYLNGSKVLTTGTGLTFDGNNLLVGQTSNPSSYRLAVTGTVGMTGDFARFLDGAYSGYVGKASALVSGGSASDFAVRSDANLVLAAGGATGIATVSSSGLALTSGNLGIGYSTFSNAAGASGRKIIVGDAATSATPAAITVYSGTATYGGVYFADGWTGDQAYRGYVEYNHATDTLSASAAGGAGGWSLSASGFNVTGIQTITANSSSAALTVTQSGAGPVLNLSGLPTSAAGLSAGDIWNDSGTLKVV